MKRKLSMQYNPVTMPLVNAVVVPIIEWCKAQRGRKTELVNAFKRAAQPEVATRNLIESWITDDPDRRNQPTLGNGLLLQAVAKQLGIYQQTKAK